MATKTLYQDKEYDFSKGKRGKFYHPNARLNLPIYLEPDVEEFIQKHKKEKKVDISKIVNQWLRNNIKVIRSIL